MRTSAKPLLAAMAALAASAAMAGHSREPLDFGQQIVPGSGKVFPGMEIRVRSISPDAITHGPVVVPLEILNLTPEKRDITVDFGREFFLNGSINIGEMRRVVSLPPSASVVADFSFPMVSHDPSMYGRYGNTVVSLHEGSGVKYFNDVVGKITPGRCGGERIWNVLIGEAVDTITTVADYTRADESKKTTYDFRFSVLSPESPLWSDDWRAYCPYDAVLLTGDEWTRITASARRAIAGYAAHGGLVILSGVHRLPEEFAGLVTVPDKDGLDEIGVGFGSVFLALPVGVDRKMPISRTMLSDMLVSSCKRLCSADGECVKTNDALGEFDLRTLPGPPVGFVTVVLGAFALIVVPAVVIVCARKKRRIASLVVLPTVAMVIAIVAVIGMLASYGVTPTLLQKASVVIDQAGRRAAVHAISTVFAPTDVTDKLRFSRTGAVTAIGGNGQYRFLNGEELRAEGPGWLDVLVPRPYAISDVCDTTVRVEVRETEPGRKVRVTNLLGAPVERLVLYDSTGAAYEAKDMAAGATAELSSCKDPFKAAPDFGFRGAGIQYEFTARSCVYYARMSCVPPLMPDLLGGAKANRHVETNVFGRYGGEGK